MGPIYMVFLLFVALAYSSITTACPGCPQEKDVTDPFVQQFLASTLTHAKAPPKGTDNELTTLVRVTKVTYQIVAGIKYTYDFEARGVKTHKLYTCSLSVISQPWAEGEVVDNFQCTPSNLLSKSNGNENTIPGAPQEKDVTDPFVQEFLASTLTHVKAPPKGTDNELTTLIRVTKVTSQVVAGMKYTYEFEAKGVKTHRLYSCTLIIFSQPWGEGEVVDEFRCQPLSSNLLLRSMSSENVAVNAVPGAPQEKDVDDPFVQQFLASTLTHVKAPPKGTDNELTTLVRVTKVTYQIVAGIKYTYNFEARGVKTHQLYTCSLSVVSQPWAEGESVQDFKCEPLYLRTVKNTLELNVHHKPCPGCPMEHNVEDPFVQQFLASTLTHAKAPPKGTDNELTTLVKVTRVSSQIVSGIKYTYEFEAEGVKTHKMYTCRIVVFSRPWAEGDSVNSYQCKPLVTNLLKSSPPSDLAVNAVPGAPREKSVDDPAVQQFLASTLTHVKAPPKGTDNELTTLVRITRVTYQVVSGIKYTYDFEARGVKTHQLYTCRLSVVSQPWAEGESVQDFQCEPLYLSSMNSENVAVNAIPGAPQEKDVEDPFVQQFLASTLTHVKAPPKGTDNELTTLVRVTKVTYQIVAGIKYTYNFEARGVKTHQLYTCSLSVVSRPWAEGESVQDFKCKPLYLRSINSENAAVNAIPGAPQEKDVNDPFVQQFLASTLTHVKAPPKGTDNELTTLVRVTKVTYQIVAGIKYTYNFEARGVKTHQLYTCSLSVVSRPWAEGESVQDFKCEPLYLRY